MSKGKLRSIVVNDIEWNYVVEHNMDRKAEVRIYDTKTNFNSFYDKRIYSKRIKPKTIGSYV